MSSFIRNKIEETQFEQLINAISSGSSGYGAWQLVSSDITEIPWGTLNCDEILCIVKQTIGQKPTTAFILPYAEMGRNVPIIDGSYYNSNYYYSFGIQSGSTNLYVNPSWCRGYENGTVISGSNFVMDVYVRKSSSDGTGTGNTKMKVTTWGTELEINDSENITMLFSFGSNLYTIWIPSTDEIHVRDLYIANEYFAYNTLNFNDRVLNIPITITRESGTNNITITSASDMTMCVFYS